VRTSKERIADLQLQAADDLLESGGGPALLASPERYRLLAGDQLRLASPVPLMRETAPAPPRESKQPAPATPRESRQPAPTPVREQPPSAPRQMRVVLQIPSADDSSSETVAEEVAARQPMVQPAAGAPFLDALESIRDEVERPYSPPLMAKAAEMAQAVAHFFARKQVVAATVAVVVIVLLLAVAKDHAWGEFGRNVSAPTTGTRQPSADPVPALTASALGTPVRDASVGSANSTVARGSVAKTVAQKPRVDEHSAARKVDEQPKSDSRKFSVPTLSNSVISHLDSVISKAGTAPREENFTVQPAAIAFGPQHFAGGDGPTAPLRARLIGDLPTPRIPPQTSDVEGDVRVRFTVDPQGQPIMSTFVVVTSPHPLLTAAVRKVIPEMRFEPARTGGIDGRAIPDVVETLFRFTRATR
jgi:TonB family protein